MFIFRGNIAVNVGILSLCYEFRTDRISKIPNWMIENRAGGDIFSPFKNGKSWTFEFLEQYQPRTASQLMGGGNFEFIAKEMPARSGRSYISHLVQDVNGQTVEICRRSYVNNPDDANYESNIEQITKTLTKNWGRSMVPEQRYLSLPKPLSMAYYYRLDGLRIPSSVAFGINGRILPFSSRNQWIPIDELLGDFRLKKKILPVFEEMIPDIKPNRSDLPYTNFMMFLCSNGTFPPTKPREGDYFFVKNHIQDGIIYYVRDADFENMTILADPAEAIDKYCEHALLRKETRFDFRPWSVPFVAPSSK